MSEDREGSQTPHTLTQVTTLSNPSSLIPLTSSAQLTAGEREHEGDQSYTGVAETYTACWQSKTKSATIASR